MPETVKFVPLLYARMALESWTSKSMFELVVANVEPVVDVGVNIATTLVCVGIESANASPLVVNFRAAELRYPAEGKELNMLNSNVGWFAAVVCPMSRLLPLWSYCLTTNKLSEPLKEVIELISNPPPATVTKSCSVGLAPSRRNRMALLPIVALL